MADAMDASQEGGSYRRIDVITGQRRFDKRGRFVAGSMDTMEEGPNGAFYSLHADLSLHKLDDGIIVSNGPAGARTTRPSTSPIPGPARSGPTTMTST
jgi:hypothetical protein